MGNTCKSYESEYEIQSGTGVYSFKRAVIYYYIILFTCIASSKNK